MQAYANVGTAPVRKTSGGTGKTYWEFRAGESSKGDDRDPTWYTVKFFSEDDPQLAKGDFVVFMGKLKVDVFASSTSPTGFKSAINVMAFTCAKVDKTGGKSGAGNNRASTPPASSKAPEKVLVKETPPPARTNAPGPAQPIALSAPLELELVEMV